jgi:hypothetical protein
MILAASTTDAASGHVIAGRVANSLSIVRTSYIARFASSVRREW